MDRILDVIRYHLTPDMIAFDVGANWGGYALTMASICRQVVGFEPIPRLAEDLRHRAPPNLLVETLALSDRAGRAEFHIDLREGLNAQQSSLLRVDELHDKGLVETVQVETLTLDAYVESRGVRPDFIKIDVEGWEPAVFAGATRIIREHRPVLLFEMWETHYPRYKPWFEMLGETHHLVRAGDGAPAYDYYEAEVRYEVGDILCIPRRT